MASGVIIKPKKPRGKRHGAQPWALLGLAMSSASCVPLAAEGPRHVEIALPIVADSPTTTRGLLGAQPASLETGSPLASLGPAAGSFIFDGRTPLDRMRSLDCLAQAIYYEARSEGEAGQRAVAQVVLNRVRHRDYPSTVCGVVYQHVRGQTCQFSFSCDGSMRRRRERFASFARPMPMAPSPSPSN